MDAKQNNGEVERTLFRRIAIIVRPNTPDANNLAKVIIPKLMDKGHELIIDDRIAAKIGYPQYSSPLQELEADLIITLGGDGTILHVIREIKDPGTKILGVNFGSRGVLSEIDPCNFDEAWFLIEEGKYMIHSCTQLATEVNDARVSDALNEALLTAPTPAKIIEVTTTLNRDVIMEGKLDGVIVATTTGSTAYALSAGGPLVHPLLDCFVIVPIFPINFDLRPIVVSSSTAISIDLLMSQRGALLTMDGQHSFDVPPRAHIRFYPSEIQANFVRIQRRIPRMRIRLATK